MTKFLKRILVVDDKGDLSLVNIAVMLWVIKLSLSEITWQLVAIGLSIFAVYALKIHYERLEKKDKIDLDKYNYKDLANRIANIEAALTLGGRML
jgi:hypothetical protein